MRRVTQIIALAVGLVVAAPLGCRDEPPAPAEATPALSGGRMAEPAPTGAAEPTEAANPAEAAKPAEVDAATPTPTPAEADASAPPADGEAAADAAGSGRVDQALCDAACEHALAVTAAELPADTSDEVRSAMRVAMRDKCPKACMDKGTMSSVQCIIKASTVLQISACSP